MAEYNNLMTQTTMNLHKYSRLLLLLLIPILLLSNGCKKSETPFYNPRYNAVRFPYATNDKGIKEPTGYVPGDKTFYKSYSFFSDPDAESHIDSIPLYLIGLKSDTDRAVNIEVIKDESAPADYFEVLGASVPANAMTGAIKFKLINRKELKEHDVQIAFRIKDSDDLLAGPPEFTKAVMRWGIRLEPPVLATHFMTYNALIQGSDMAFSDSKDYFSVKALEVIVAALNWNDWDDKVKHGSNNANPGGYKYLPWDGAIRKTYLAYAKKIADYIEDYNTHHPGAPLIHDGGALKGKRIEARTK